VDREGDNMGEAIAAFFLVMGIGCLVMVVMLMRVFERGPWKKK
jgi:hypothetical protein